LIPGSQKFTFFSAINLNAGSQIKTSTGAKIFSCSFEKTFIFRDLLSILEYLVQQFQYFVENKEFCQFLCKELGEVDVSLKMTRFLKKSRKSFGTEFISEKQIDSKTVQDLQTEVTSFLDDFTNFNQFLSQNDESENEFLMNFLINAKRD
jgi:hypothetical protein